MAKKSKEPTLTCDFGGVTRRWGLRWTQIDNDISILYQVVFAEEKDGLSEEQSERVTLGKIDARRQINELINERELLMSQVITSVPREWLAEAAPDDIDWSNPESLALYIPEEMTSNLIMGVGNARTEASKNLLARTYSNGKTQPPQ